MDSRKFELNDDNLDTVSGGTASAEHCTKCGNPLSANNYCTVCNVLKPLTPGEILKHRGLGQPDDPPEEEQMSEHGKVLICIH